MSSSLLHGYLKYLMDLSGQGASYLPPQFDEGGEVVLANTPLSPELMSDQVSAGDPAPDSLLGSPQNIGGLWNGQQLNTGLIGASHLKAPSVGKGVRWKPRRWSAKKMGLKRSRLPKTATSAKTTLKTPKSAWSLPSFAEVQTGSGLTKGRRQWNPTAPASTPSLPSDPTGQPGLLGRSQPLSPGQTQSVPGAVMTDGDH